MKITKCAFHIYHCLWHTNIIITNYITFFFFLNVLHLCYIVFHNRAPIKTFVSFIFLGRGDSKFGLYNNVCATFFVFRKLMKAKGPAAAKVEEEKKKGLALFGPKPPTPKLLRAFGGNINKAIIDKMKVLTAPQSHTSRQES